MGNLVWFVCSLSGLKQLPHAQFGTSQEGRRVKHVVFYDAQIQVEYLIRNISNMTIYLILKNIRYMFMIR